MHKRLQNCRKCQDGDSAKYKWDTLSCTTQFLGWHYTLLHRDLFSCIIHSHTGTYLVALYVPTEQSIWMHYTFPNGGLFGCIIHSHTGIYLVALYIPIWWLHYKYILTKWAFWLHYTLLIVGPFRLITQWIPAQWSFAYNCRNNKYTCTYIHKCSQIHNWCSHHNMTEILLQPLTIQSLNSFIHVGSQYFLYMRWHSHSNMQKLACPFNNQTKSCQINDTKQSTVPYHKSIG